MSRAPKKPILYQERLNLPESVFRFATPKEPALYRADRLKCDSLVEIGAGIGGQTFAFAKVCKKVIAIEINKIDAEILIENLKILKIKNVEVIIGDALDKKLIEKIKKENPDVIFCDTARKPEGERSIKDIEPDVKKLLKEYSKITTKIAIEIPPFTKDVDSLKEDFEKEFISVDKKLNRLNLYFNELKETNVSVVSLPSKHKIKSDNLKVKVVEVKSAKGFSYIYEIDPSLLLSGIEDSLSKKFDLKKLIVEDKKYFVSNDFCESEFLEGYDILSVCENNFETILENLKKLKARKVILKFKISPEEYWKKRKKYEDNLTKEGIETFLFVNNNEAIICQ